MGIVRSKKSLGQALKMLKQVNPNQAPANREEIELRNLAQVAKLITQAALDRKESRGAHFRSDFPKKNDKKWQKHLIYKIG